MRFFKVITIVILFCLPTLAEAREIPMWEGVTKTSAQRAADKQFVQSVINKGGKKAGANRANQLGWKFIGKRNPNMAIKRFNQAWLLDPSNANIYWGYAVAVHQQGRPLSEVNRFFNKAERGFYGQKNALVDLYADKAQILGERRKFAESIKIFEKALKLNPMHKRSIRGIKISARAIGDKKTLSRYK